MGKLRRRHAKTLGRVWERPPRADIRGSEVESMLKALGAVVSQGRGSRVRIMLNNVRAVFHRPHPGDGMNKGVIRALQRFLDTAGYRPED